MPLDHDNLRRFSGIRTLYGEPALAQFRLAHVCIIGIGGVGSWVAEALARSAIGQITLIDMDHIAESNINRQLHALSSTLGESKIGVMADRIRDINPDCVINTIDDFISSDNLSACLDHDYDHDYDYVIDCIDNFRIKAALLAWCRRNKMRVITVGAAGGLMDPTEIQITDLSRTWHDALLARTRRCLRQEYGFSSNTKRRFGIPAVFSNEQLMQKPTDYASGSGGLSCSSGLGSATPITGSFGFSAAAWVLKKLT